MSIDKYLYDLEWLQDELKIKKRFNVVESNSFDNAIGCYRSFTGPICLVYSQERLKLSNIPIVEGLIHELFHIEQLINISSGIIDCTAKYGSIIQSSILDLFVVNKMILKSLYNEALTIFKYRLNHLSDCSFYKKNSKIFLHRIASIKKESFFYCYQSSDELFNNFINKFEEWETINKFYSEIDLDESFD
ncbi:MAG: hypothetical protein ACFFDF_20510, partial [Candidatus Odinarchaeota archaeon]